MNKLVIAIILLSINSNGFSQVREEPIMLRTKDCNIQGTLMMPARVTNMVVLIVGDAGAIDRNGNQSIYRTDSYKMYALALAENGIASVRYDKRGIAASSHPGSRSPNSNNGSLHLSIYIEDVKGWVDLLSQRFQKIVLAGHREGALLSLVVAESRTDVSGIISIGGIGRRYDAVLKEKHAKHSNELIRDIAYEIIDTLCVGNMIYNVPVFLRSDFDLSIQPYLISVLSYDPAAIIARVKVPILIVHGATDAQVSAENAQALYRANRKAKLKFISNMNHVMKWCSSMDVDEQLDTYINPIYPLADDLIRESIAFIKAL